MLAGIYPSNGTGYCGGMSATGNTHRTETRPPCPRRSIPRLARTVFAMLGLLVATVATWSLAPFTAWLPHERIVLSLPFAPQDEPQNMIPMGETIEHPHAPHGHPGIDFQWDHSVPIIACAAGRVTDISYRKDHKSWDVTVRTGVYEVRYKELDDYTRSLQVGAAVQKGDLIGFPCHPLDLPDGNPRHFQIHWELASACLWKDRFCPLNYFETDSRTRIEAIWTRTDNKFKRQFRDICSGDYRGRED